MKTVVSKQKVQVIARNAPWNVRVLRANQFSTLLPYRFQPGINFTTPPALKNDGFEFSFAGRAHAHTHAIVCKDFEFIDVGVGLPCHDRVHAA